MPTSFLDLSREIRDEIYSFLLISPTDLIKPRVLTRSPPHIELLIPLSSSSTSGKSSTSSSSKDASHAALSLSILRTCRQIYSETHPLFWSSATFFFSNYSLHERGLVNTLKVMGQLASRLITRVRILMKPRPSGGRSSGPPYGGLAKALQTLASRARHGCLKEVELVWERYAVDIGRRARGSEAYEKLLGILRKASEGCRYQRTIKLPRRAEGYDADMAFPRELHQAFGGRLFVGEVLVWEDYRKVGLDGGVSEVVQEGRVLRPR